jgi:hypothetical protein
MPDDDVPPEEIEVTCAGGMTIPPLGAGNGPAAQLAHGLQYIKDRYGPAAGDTGAE